MTNIIICGAPGSGKGTQSDLIVDRYGLVHLSTGDLLRAEIRSGSQLGKKIDSIISEGNLMPDDIMLSLLEQHIKSLPTDTKGIILDGFPRTVHQAQDLEDLMLRTGDSTVAVIDLHVGEQELIQRLIYRGQVSGRADDNEHTIRHRLEVYHKQTEPVTAFYQQLGKYYRIDGTGEIADIFERISRTLDEKLN